MKNPSMPLREVLRTHRVAIAWFLASSIALAHSCGMRTRINTSRVVSQSTSAVRPHGLFCWPCARCLVCRGMKGRTMRKERTNRPLAREVRQCPFMLSVASACIASWPPWLSRIGSLLYRDWYASGAGYHGFRSAGAICYPTAGERSGDTRDTSRDSGIRSVGRGIDANTAQHAQHVGFSIGRITGDGAADRAGLEEAPATLSRRRSASP